MYKCPPCNWLIIFTILTIYPQILVNAQSQSTIITPEKSQDYYHLKLTLTSKNTTSISKSLRAGGAFEITVSKETFPKNIKFAKDTQHIKLTMPPTKTGLPGASLYINEKKRLFENINTIMKHRYRSISVIVEFPPHISVISQSPLKLQLLQPEMTFRHAYGRYINYTGELKPHDKQ